MRRLIAQEDILVLPGVHDALGARLAERAGFQAIVSGGYSASATLLGQADSSQLSYTEMRDYYARLCEATTLPVLADADTGYGGTTNVARTVRGYERAGVAALLLEDQVFPKSCGHFSGKSVIAVGEYIAKIKAALDARTDPDLIIVARTDAVAVAGLDAAIERMQLAHEAGADLLFMDALETTDQMRRFTRETPGPCLASVIEGGRTPALSAAQCAQLGFAAVLYAISATYACARALKDLYAALARDGGTAAVADRLVSFSEFNEIVGLSALREREVELDAFAVRLVAAGAARSRGR
ncbi:MAG TPA: isocitrate lyase/PEP mutase family protein [Ramlibacter sp.]|nr:isocitrate lyase/PEP mutase family protein [Ramlibacter sp.]